MGKKRVWIGAALTLAYVLGLLFLGAWRWGELVALSLNEFGDFLAGAFGPLAILWLVLGYFQQGEELQQNTEALRLQAEELKNSVKQQSLLVETAKQQIDLEQKRHEDSLRRASESLEPRFVLKIQKAGNVTDNKHYKIEFRNVGARCTGLVATLDWGAAFSQSEEFGPVDSFGEFSLDIAWPHPEFEPKEVKLILQYYILQGGIRSTSVPLEFFWVVSGLFFLRQRESSHLLGPDP